jgi:hypothetical protein
MGCGNHDMTVEGNFFTTADAQREALRPLCCCHGRNINGHSSGPNGTSIAKPIIADNQEVDGEWPPAALRVIQQAGPRHSRRRR